MRTRYVVRLEATEEQLRELAQRESALKAEIERLKEEVEARVLGLSGISNVLPAEGAPPVETTHEEVLEAGRLLVPRLEAIIRGVLRAQ